MDINYPNLIKIYKKNKKIIEPFPGLEPGTHNIHTLLPYLYAILSTISIAMGDRILFNIKVGLAGVSPRPLPPPPAGGELRLLTLMRAFLGPAPLCAFHCTVTLVHLAPSF